MSATQPGKRRDSGMDLATLKLERRGDGRLWLKRDGDDDPWYEAAVRDAKRADDTGPKGKGQDESSVAEDGVAVRIAPCFPWSRARQYISVRTADDKEIALIGSLDQLAEQTRHLVEEALAEIGFVLEITRVISIRTEIEIRNWQVDTRQGPCTFQTKLDDWPHPIGGRAEASDAGDEDASADEAPAPPCAFVLRDVAGNLYLIPDPATLDGQSRRLLWPFIG